MPLLVGGKAGFRLGRRAHVVVVEASAPALGERSYRLIGAARGAAIEEDSLVRCLLKFNTTPGVFPSPGNRQLPNYDLSFSTGAEGTAGVGAGKGENCRSGQVRDPRIVTAHQLASPLARMRSPPSSAAETVAPPLSLSRQPFFSPLSLGVARKELSRGFLRSYRLIGGTARGGVRELNSPT